MDRPAPGHEAARRPGCCQVGQGAGQAGLGGSREKWGAPGQWALRLKEWLCPGPFASGRVKTDQLYSGPFPRAYAQGFPKSSQGPLPTQKRGIRDSLSKDHRRPFLSPSPPSSLLPLHSGPDISTPRPPAPSPGPWG